MGARGWSGGAASGKPFRRRGAPGADPPAEAAPPVRRLTQASLREGARRLAAADPDLARVLTRLGVPPMWGRRPGFATLVRIVLEQQVSLTAARTMYRRLQAHLGGVTPEAIHGLQVTGLRDLGLTRQKAGYCLGLAARVLDGTLDLKALCRRPDPVGRRILLAVPGLGPWSVDIYYLMALRRADVWPQGDLALGAALQEVKGLDALPDQMAQQSLAGRWAPWRSVAARMLWAHYLSARGRKAGQPAIPRRA
jgi:DNA-3-methyladenine glycosylase II